MHHLRNQPRDDRPCAPLSFEVRLELVF
jgi:hypothetical protein